MTARLGCNSNFAWSLARLPLKDVSQGASEVTSRGNGRQKVRIYEYCVSAFGRVDL